MAKTKAPTLQQITKRALDEGGEADSTNCWKLIGIPKPAKSYVLEALGEETEDGRSHVFAVVTSTTTLKAVSLCFSVLDMGRPARDDIEFIDYSATPAGALQDARRAVGKLDEAGQVIKNSQVLTSFDIKDSAIKANYQRELDFWLKGKGRKKKAAKKPAK